MNVFCFVEPLIVFQLTSLDYVLETERESVFGPSFSFQTFLIESPVGPRQPNEYDCGMFVCMLLNDEALATDTEITAAVSALTIYRHNFPIHIMLITLIFYLCCSITRKINGSCWRVN